MSNKIKLTDAELDILSVLWTNHGTTVREVYESLNTERKTSYTTFLKQMQIMYDKNLVQRDAKQKAHIYYAAIDRLELGKEMLNDILQKIYNGSKVELVEQVLNLETGSKKEIKKIGKLVKQTAKEKKDKSSKKGNKKIVLKEIE